VLFCSDENLAYPFSSFLVVDLLAANDDEADSPLKQGAVCPRCVQVLNELKIHLTVLSVLQQKLSLENY
jgi:hypothetical protein